VFRSVAFVYLRYDQIQFILFGAATVVVVALLFGRLFQRMGQPPVIGEVIAGICLGPSLLGHFSTVLFPLESRPLLKLLSTLGVVTFMFLIGLELRLGHLKQGRKRVAAGVALLGTLIPFGLGLLMAFPLYASHNHARFLAFAVFMGAAMSITAFPVLARIMIEKKMYSTPLGVVTMACAAGDDVLTWATVAFVLAVMSSASGWDLPYICGAAAVFAVVMIKVLRPRLERFSDRSLDSTTLSAIVAALLLCAFATAALGLHEIFGAFLAGAIFPRGRLAEQVRDRVSSVALILLPMFFVVTGLNVHIGGVGGQGIWQLGLILVVACVGKLLGGVLGARASGLKMRESVALGVLMNTRGLTELIVLNIGLQAGVIDTRLFTLLVLMAVVTTVATGPLLDLIKPDPYLGELGPALDEPLSPVRQT
jgi:Kef-type K+ transport system membrane component KefB